MLVSIREAANALSISEQQVRILIRSGKWPAYSFGKRATRIDLDEIKKLTHYGADNKINDVSIGITEGKDG